MDGDDQLGSAFPAAGSGWGVPRGTSRTGMADLRLQVRYFPVVHLPERHLPPGHSESE
jgi:hypothetical protein